MTSERERNKVRDLLEELDSKRALWVPFNHEDHYQVVKSIQRIRQKLLSTLKAIPEDSPARRPVRTMRLTCERFLTNTPTSDLAFYSNLGELRGVFGACLLEVIEIYNLKVEKPLADILPPRSEQEITQFEPDGNLWGPMIYVNPPRPSARKEEKE
jgi:hypothetical protein